MNDDVIWITRNGVHIPINTNQYMNDKIRGTYIIEKKQDTQFKNYKTMKLLKNKEQAGYLEYQDNNGEITVNVIKTEDKYKRQGVATRLLKELKNEYGDKIYKFSAVLSDGEKLLKSKTNIIKKENGNYYVKIK